MATLTQTNLRGVNGPVVVASATLTASDTFAYSKGTGQVLELFNGTAGALTANIDGAAGTTIVVAGLGAPVDVSAGFNVALTAGQTKAVPLDSISAYLQGTIAMTGAAGVTARLFVA